MSPVYAQDISTQGKEFWVSFMGNGYKTNVDLFESPWVINQVLISGKRDCTGTIENPITGWSQTFNVRANSITTIDNLEAQSYVETSDNERIISKGLRIVTTDTVSVFCTNIANVSFDASYVLPIHALADDYMIQSYDQSTYVGSGYEYAQFLTSAFLIVATEDNTTIDITPTVESFTGNHPSYEEYSITMNAGEVYQFRSTSNGNHRDLSGTRITARDCKKIAVFNGNTLTAIPDSRTSRDIVFEQAMPLQAWGKSFVVTSSYGRNDDYVKVTSSSVGNEILKNGEPLTTLNVGESYIFVLTDTDASCFIESTLPAAVFLYNTSYNSYDQSGDPSMVWIAPIEQRIDEITFTTFHDAEHADIDNHYVNIIVNTEDISTVYFDDELISPLLFQRVNGNNDYSYVKQQITHDVHHLSCAHGFNAHVYGFGHAKGYAYLVGSKATNLSTSLVINDISIQPHETYSYCVEEPIVFSAEVNLQNYNLTWDFGDGTTSSQNPVTHVYHDRALFTATLSVTTEAGGCTGSESDTTKFYIDATQQYVYENDEICVGGLYSGFGFNNVHISNDTILSRLQSNPIHPECHDSLLVYITTHPSYHVPINDSRCWQGEPGIYDGYGFSFEYDHPGTFDRELYLFSVNGCDSVLNLHLTVADQITYEFDHHECGNSYVWDGQSYSTSGDYERYYTSPGGCDSIVTLHLTMGHPQHTSFDTITCGVFYWNGMEYVQTGTYQQQFTTYDGCDSIVDCHLTLSGNVEGPTFEVSECDSYHWFDADYTVPGLYQKTLSTPLGCDSTVYLNLDLEYTPDPSPIYPKDPENTAPHWVVTATEFQINEYEFHFWDHNSHCRWDSITWAFENPEVQWIIEPDSTTNPVGKSCKIYVLNQVDDTVWLSAKVYNKCHPQGIERRYWFVCSFYGLEEDGTSTSSEAFNVIPNPNNGQMYLNFENLTGKIDLKIYDMRGCLVDQFQVISEAGTYSMPYQCKLPNDGLYLFVASCKNAVLTKKVVVFQ